MSLKQVDGRQQLSVIQKTSSFGGLYQVVIIKDTWEELLPALLEAVNKDIVAKEFTLIDMGFTSKSRDDPGGH